MLIEESLVGRVFFSGYLFGVVLRGNQTEHHFFFFVFCGGGGESHCRGSLIPEENGYLVVVEDRIRGP